MLGHSVDKYVTGRLLDTSNGLGWSHLHAERWSHMPGELPALTPRDTEIAILLRGRSFVDRIGSGQRQRTHGRRGTVWVCPAGIEEEYINISDPMVDCLHIFLPARPFADTMLRDLDVDPAGSSCATTSSRRTRSSTMSRDGSCKRWRARARPDGC